MFDRVVITGIGVVAPNGVGSVGFWDACTAGRSGVGPIGLFDPEHLDCKIAAQIDDRQLPPISTQTPEFTHQRPAWIATTAAEEALVQSGVLENSDAPPSRRLVVVGGGCVDNLNDILISTIVRANPEARGNPDGVDLDKLAADFLENPFVDAYDQYAMTRLAPTLATRCTAWQSWTLSTACAGGAQAIHDAYRALRAGHVDFALAGGVDSLITRQMMAGFSQLTALSTRNDEPERASRPFDRERDGFVMGEGGAFLVLERADHAQRRGATILAELAGAGISSDAWRLTDPREDATGMVLSMERALHDAQANRDEVSYINAHGTSTQANDKAETLAIHRLLGEAARTTPVSSTKSMTGHLIHGAGAIEAVCCVQALGNDAVPPTINYEYPDPDCDLDYVPNEARDVGLNLVLSNSFGFGGQNTTLAFRRWNGAI